MRKTRNRLILLAWLLPLQLFAEAPGVWIDLTHDLSSEAVFWPTAEPFSMTTDFEGMTDKGYYYSAYSFSTAEHGGTHIDAPVHFARGANHVDEIPLDQLIGDAVVIDVSGEVSKNRDHLVSKADLQAWEAQHGEIPPGSIVLLRTGFGQFWPDAERYLGTPLRGAEGVAQLSFPGLDPVAAAWLVQNREIKAVGIDTASIDFGKSTQFKTHVTLMTQNVPVFENVANLDQLPPTGAYIIALPVKIRGGSGGPLRIIARKLVTDQRAKQVEDTERAFAATMTNRDFEGFKSFLSDETVFFSGKTQLRGKQQVADAWKPYFEAADAPFSWQPETVAVLDSGGLALSSGPVFGPDGKQVGVFNSTWRLDADGQWRIVFDKGGAFCE